MIDEKRQDLAAEYALDALDPESTRAFEKLLASDPELKALSDQLRETAALLAHDATPTLLPPGLRQRVLSRIHAEAEAVTPPAGTPVTPSAAPTPSSSSANLLPWAVAAGFAITTGALWMERDQLRKETEGLKHDLVAIRGENTFVKMKIATLSAQVDAYAKAQAVVVWDPQKQAGVIKLANIPQPEAGKDYQLWVIGQKRAPVSAGVVTVSAEGNARVDFKPGQPIKADQFAISIEPTGGVPAPTGPVVLAGN
jgi:anti-sigma-K factor RskA